MYNCNRRRVKKTNSGEWAQQLKVPATLRSAKVYGKLFEACGFREYSYLMIPDRTLESNAEYYGHLTNLEQRRRFLEQGLC